MTAVNKPTMLGVSILLSDVDLDKAELLEVGVASFDDSFEEMERISVVIPTTEPGFYDKELPDGFKRECEENGLFDDLRENDEVSEGNRELHRAETFFALERFVLLNFPVLETKPLLVCKDHELVRKVLKKFAVNLLSYIGDDAFADEVTQAVLRATKMPRAFEDVRQLRVTLKALHSNSTNQTAPAFVSAIGHV